MKAVYDKIYRDIKRRIESGEFAWQEFLPSENTLIAEYNCSHNTVRKALAILAREGYIVPVHGKGVRVIYYPRSHDRVVIDGLGPFKNACAEKGLKLVTKVISFERVVVTPELSEITDFDEGEELLVVERVRNIDGRNVYLTKNYLLASVVGDMTPEDAEDSIYSYLERERGMKVAVTKRLFLSEPVADHAREYLDFEGFQCAATMVNRVYNTEGTYFEYSKSCCSPHDIAMSDIIIRNGNLSFM